MNYRKNTNDSKSNGITLIALVITIIVLLILAGVSLNMLLGENGILTKVQIAKGSQERAGLKEEAQLTMLSLETEKLTSDDSKSFKEVLESGISGATIEAVNVAEGSNGLTDVYYVLKGGNYVTVYEDGEVLEGKVEIWDGSSINSPEFKKENNIWNWYIYTPSQLKFLADFVNNGDGVNVPESLVNTVESAGYTASDIKMTADTTIYLMKDIDLGARHANGELIAGTAWTPINTSASNLGIFEGCNHTIRGVYVNRTGNYSGLFGYSNTIRNLTIKDGYIQGNNATGGIVGYATSGKIENCHNENTFVNGLARSSGGIAGMAKSSFEKCTNNGTVVGSESWVGGITGIINSNSCEIVECNNFGTVTGNNASVGGIVGYVQNINRTYKCTNAGTVTGKGDYVGGIGGTLCGNTEECINTGVIMGDRDAGGIAGAYFIDTMRGCINSGTVTVGGGTVGGIAGAISQGATLTQCSNTGVVTGTIDRTGGVVGTTSFAVTVAECSNTGTVTGGEFTGGIVGIFSTDSNDPSDAEPPVLRKCLNSGNLKGVHDTGGIIGAATQYGSLIEKCYNLGEVEGTDANTGGIAGALGRSSKIHDCYNVKPITGTTTAGGLLGYAYGSKCEIKNCYNIGLVGGNDKLGGILGNNTNSSEIINSYYLDGTASLDIGTGTTSDLKKDKTYIKTTFVETANAGETVWEINESENNGFPVLINSND